MEQLTAELDSRNRELAALREKFQPLQSAQSESRQQLEEAKQAIQIGEQELFSIRSGLEEARNRHQV
jgi:predicted  nucleic acid-binding Zn-ribbon protein